MKNGENQNPDANNKFVSAYRGKSGIEYGKVYTDTESGKTYVSYNYGQNKQGEAIDVYYLPNGKGLALNLKDSVKGQLVLFRRGKGRRAGSDSLCINRNCSGRSCG